MTPRHHAAPRRPPRYAPCTWFRVLISPMFLLVWAIVAANYLPYVVWTPHETAGAWAAILIFHVLLAGLIASYLARGSTPFPPAPARGPARSDRPRLSPLANPICAHPTAPPPPRLDHRRRPPSPTPHTNPPAPSPQMTVFTDPGTVPLEWHAQVAADDKLANAHRLCAKSGLYRPLRRCAL